MTLKKIVGLFVFGMTIAPVPADAIVMKFDFLQDDKHQHENDSLKAACEVCNPPKKDEKGKKEKKDKKSEYEKLIEKGGSHERGVMDIRHIEDKWYMEVPDSMIGRLFLVVSRFTATPQGLGLYSGEEITRSAVYFEKRDDKTLLLRSYVQTHQADDRDNIAIALRKSAIDPIIASLKIIGRPKKGKTQLVDVTMLFKKDNGVFGISSAERKNIKVGALDDTRTFIDTIKTYPINVEVVTTRTYNAEPGITNASKMGAMTIGMNTSIVLLPKEPMQPRYFDERVGYFADRIVNFSDEKQGTEREMIVSRYRLEPKDLKAYQEGKLVEPKKQIVYYIDPATPKKWIPYLIQGVNDWNIAFEAAGFKNAIVAKEWPGDKDMSLEDARYCVLRYLPSDKQNAYGPRVVDPRSGEIIESHICWYHDVMKLVKSWYMIQCGPLDKRAQTMDFDDELMGQLIRFVSSHEVGHTLGLRHNMISSSFTPVEKLRDKKWVEAHGHTYSIMDYARFNYVAQPEDGISEKGLFPRINDYDKWAIKWGYQYLPEYEDPLKEKEALRKQVTQVLSEKPYLAASIDEGKGTDPRSQTESVGDNNMKASDYGIKNLKRVMKNLEKWTAQPDGQYDDLSDIYKGTLSQFQRYCGHVQKNIRGRYRNTVPGMKPYDYVPKNLQQEAVQWMGRHVLEAPLWLYPQSIVDKVGIDPEEDILKRSQSVLAFLLASGMFVNQYKDGVYPINEYLDDVFAQVWKPLNQQVEKRNVYRRQLERLYVSFLDNSLNPQPVAATAPRPSTAPAPTTSAVPNDLKIINSDAILYLLQHLTKVENYIKQQLNASPKGSVNAMHYEDLLLRIKKLRDEHEGKIIKQ